VYQSHVKVTSEVGLSLKIDIWISTGDGCKIFCNVHLLKQTVSSKTYQAVRRTKRMVVLALGSTFTTLSSIGNFTQTVPVP